MRWTARLLVFPVLVLAIALSGCGGGSDSGSALDNALGYLPKDAPFAVAIATDVEGDQYQALGKLIGRFPFGRQALQSLQQQIEAGDSKLDYEDDVKPLLGNPFVAGSPSAENFVSGNGDDFIGAVQAKDGDKLEEVLEKSGAKEVGEKSDAKVYENGGTTFAIEGDVLVVADSRQSLDAALDQRDSDDRLDEDTFNAALDGLPKESLAQVYTDVQGLLEADPDTQDARKVKWVSALRTLGVTATAQDDSLSFDFNLKTDGDLSEEDLPIAAGDESPQVVQKAGEISFGIRDPGQIVRFGEAAGQAIDPNGFGQYAAGKKQIEERFGVTLDKDVIDQLSGDVSVNLALDGTYGVRAEVKDPAAFKRTLAKVANVLPDVAEGAGSGPVGLSKPKAGQDFYALAQPDGDTIVFGVVDDAFVLSNDPRRAGTLASESPSDVPGAKGSVVLSADAEKLAEQALAQIGPQLGLGGALGGSLFTGPLGDLTGSMSVSPDGLTGKVTLGID